MNQPAVIPTSGKPYNVKNLGWLLRHAAQVQDVELVVDQDGADMTAILDDGTRFMSRWASSLVALRWLRRRSLRHIGKRVTIAN